jgi:hypothetical protein
MGVLTGSRPLLAAATLVLAGCSAAPTLPGACQPVAPRMLPSGAPPGPPRVEQVDGIWQLAWSIGGEDTVIQAVQPAGGAGRAPMELAPDDGKDAFVRGQPASVIAIGDPPISQVAIVWSTGDCAYTVWVGPGLDLDEAIAYAGRY